MSVAAAEGCDAVAVWIAATGGSCRAPVLQPAPSAAIATMAVSPRNPFRMIAFSVIPVLLFAAAFLACYLSRRAARVDPNVALRHL